MQISTLLMACCLVTLSPTLLSAQSSEQHVGDWLRKMVSAVHSLNYQGTFVYLHGNQLESMQVIHTVGKEGERERLISLNGVPREVVRDNASVTCIAPDAKSVSISNRFAGRGFRAVFSMNTKELASYYNFHMLGDARVADRLAKVVAIVPKDGYRYGYRIYLDQKNALPLKTDMLNAEGDAVSQIMFTRIQVDPAIKDKAEFAMEGKENYAWIQQKSARLMQKNAPRRWSFAKLPGGFNITIHTTKSKKQGNSAVDHFVLSDGLASLSVYVEKTEDEGLRGNTRIGAVNAFGSEFDGHQVTVVGEVPAITVEKVADAIQSSPNR